MIILAFSGLTLILAVLSAVFGWPLALGAAAVAGGCAVWAALMSTNGTEADLAPATSSVDSGSVVPQSAGVTGSDPAVVVVVQPAMATAECAEPQAQRPAVAEEPPPTPEPVQPAAEAPVTPLVEVTPVAPPAVAVAAEVAEQRPVAETAEPRPAVVMPISVEPGEVVRALLVNAAAAGTAVSARLWLADVGTPTLRLVCSAGDVIGGAHAGAC